MTVYASSTARTMFVFTPNQSTVVAALAFEVERGERAVDADPLEHPFGSLGVLGEDRRASGPLCRRNQGRSLIEDEREALVDASKISRRS